MKDRTEVILFDIISFHIIPNVLSNQLQSYPITHLPRYHFTKLPNYPITELPSPQITSKPPFSDSTQTGWLENDKYRPRKPQYCENHPAHPSSPGDSRLRFSH